jgi:hypothetical protein
MNRIDKYNFYPEEIQEEIEKNCKECFDILRNNEKHLQKFKEIYKKKFGIELTDKEALGYAIVLLNFCRLIIRLKRNESLQNSQNKYNEKCKSN